MGLVGYLIMSYIVSYVAHIPVHGVRHSFIPAAVPWGIAAAVAVWCTMTRRTLRAAWITLPAACVFFLLPHIVRHR